MFMEQHIATIFHPAWSAEYILQGKPDLVVAVPRASVKLDAGLLYPWNVLENDPWPH